MKGNTGNQIRFKHWQGFITVREDVSLLWKWRRVVNIFRWSAGNIGRRREKARENNARSLLFALPRVSASFLFA